MADFSVSITVPDAKVNELVAALRWAWGPKTPAEGETPAVEYTPAELRAVFKTKVENSLKDIYKRHKEYLRNQQAVDTDLPVT